MLSPGSIGRFGNRGSAAIPTRNKTASQFFDSSVVAKEDLDADS